MGTAKVQGPTGRFFTGHLKEVLSDPFDFLVKHYEQSPDLTRFRVGPIDMYSVGEPSLVRQILTDNSIEKSSLNKKLFFPVIGRGLLASEGELWKRQRKSISPIFRPKKIVDYQAAMQEPVNEFVKNLSGVETVNLSKRATSVTIQILVKTIFGIDQHFAIDDLDKHLEILADQFVKRVSSVVQIPNWIPSKQNKILNHSTGKVLNIVRSLIKKHDELNGDENLSTLINALRHAEDDLGNRMSDQQLFDEVATFFLAGHEATSTTLQWAIYNLSKHTECQTLLRAELIDVLGSRMVSKEDFENLPYLKSVINETLRLFPTCYIQTREVASKSYELDGYQLKKGSLLAVPVYAMHRNSQWYPAPESFLPERWLSDDIKDIPKHAYMPFGGGKRICIGEHFSRYELMTLLATIYQSFETYIPEGAVVPGIFPAVTLRPDQDMYMGFRPVNMSK